MIALAFAFLAGRHHATGWDHHVNEGTVEWPPAPWRILRALVAASYRLGEACDRVRLQAVLERLTEPPVYYLPPVASGHVRHYMPTDGDHTTKAFDAFLATGDGATEPAELIVAWPELQLDAADEALLARVAGQVAYLGRAESWVDARLATSLPPHEPDARPVVPGEDPERTARLLAALPSQHVQIWRDGYLAAEPPGKRSKQRLPENLWDVLNLDTGALQQGGWSIAPGTRWISYALTAQPAAPRRVVPVRGGSLPDFAHLVFDAVVLPRIEDTLWIAEKVRAALLHHLGDHPSSALTGKDDQGQPLRDHGHAYFLPQADERGFVRHMYIHARGGFDAEAVRALRALRKLYKKGEALTGKPTYTTLVTLGRLDALAPASLGPSRFWESVTPFVPPRCPKERRGRIVDAPEDQLRRLCREVLKVEPVSIEMFDPEEARERRLLWFRRERRRGAPVPGMARGHGFRIEFVDEVRGPIALGYGAHFGLGQFIPRAKAAETSHISAA